MIKIIGTQKVVFLAVLLGVTVALYYYGFLVLKPQTQNVKRQLQSQQSEFSRISADMNDLVEGLKKFDGRREQFNSIKLHGFFDTQNRLEMRRRFNEMQQESRLVSAKYSINPAVTEENSLAKEAGYKILSTKVEFTLDATEDKDIYDFIYFLKYGFPAHVTINSLEISRDIEITKTLLQKLGNFEPVVIVKAKLSVNLRTLVEDEQAQSSETEGDENVY